MAADPEHEVLRAELEMLLVRYRALFDGSAASVLRADLAGLLARAPSASERTSADRPAAIRKTDTPPPIDDSEKGKPKNRAAILAAQFPSILGTSAKMLEVFERILKMAPTDTTVFIHGESGTGKELVARAIHDKSGRANKPYVAENCAALTETLLESELFGHTRGAFTGADRNRVGRFKAADHGTLFLDEVGDMSPGMQKKLLRALQEGEIRPVGAQQSIHVDVRVVSASNKDLLRLVELGRFREDLYYRLSPLRIDLPPLRERGADVLLLVDQLAQEFALKMGRPGAVEFTPAARSALARYSWPGNVRELQNELQRTLALGAPGQPIDLADLSPDVRAAGER